MNWACFVLVVVMGLAVAGMARACASKITFRQSRLMLAKSSLLSISAVCAISHAQISPEAIRHSPQTKSPFERSIRVATGIYVSDESLFFKSQGPSLLPSGPDAKDGVIERKRLGTVSIAPGVKLTLDLVTEPMGTKYDLLDVKTEKLIRSFSYSTIQSGSLLFSGQGTVYEHARIDSLCAGEVTRKFKYVDGRISEISQPMLFINTETLLLRDVKLLLAPSKKSSPVAELPKDSVATVLAYEHPNKFLIKTPLGLTGWLIDDRSESSVSISQCN